MTSSHHPEIITSDPVRISSSFTSSLGAGYKNYDNPQIALSFKLNDRLIAASSSASTSLTSTSLRNNNYNNISKNIKITFELRRHLPLNSPHHSESLGFCIVRKIYVHDSIHQNMNSQEEYSNKNWIDTPLERSREFFQVVAESEFSSCDFVRLTLDASQLFSSSEINNDDETTNENNDDFIIVCYNQTRFLAADFTLSIVISHHKNAVDHVIENLASLKKKKNITSGTGDEDDQYYSPQAPPPQSSSSSSSFSPSVCDESLPSSQNDVHENDENGIIRAPSLRSEEEELEEENIVQHSPSPRQPKRAFDPRFLLHVSKLEAIKIETKTTTLENISTTAVLSSGDDDKKINNNNNGHTKLKNYFLDPANCFPSNTELNRQICLHHQTNSSKRTKNGGTIHHRRHTFGNGDENDNDKSTISTDIELRLSSKNNQLEELRRKYFSMTSLDSSTGSSVTTSKFLHCRFFVAEISKEEEEQNRKQNIHQNPSLVGYFPLGEPDTVAQHHQNSNKLEQQQHQQKVRVQTETTSTASSSTVWKQEIQKSNQNNIKINRIHNNKNNNSVLRNPNGESYEILSESPEYSDNCFLENSSSSFVKVWRSKMMKIDFYRLLMMAVNNNNNIKNNNTCSCSPVLVRMEGLKFASSKKYRIMVWIGLEEENAFGFQQEQHNKKEENGEDNNFARKQSKNKHRIRNVELNFDLNVKHNSGDNKDCTFREFRSELSVCAPSLNNTLDAVINEGKNNDDEFHDCFIGCKYTTHQVYNNVSFSKFLSVQEAKEIVDKVSQSSSKNNQKSFVDCLFPPSTSTTFNFSPSSPKSANLSPTARSRKPKQLLDVKSLSIDSRWRRPKDFCNNPVLFSQTSSSSCRQGLLGSCSLLAACSSLFRARGTQFLQKLIYFCDNGQPNSLTTSNNSGIYAVFFFIEGDWRAVIVDDYFPCRKGKLAFARCANRNEIWISLIEKALAKVFGGFNELVRGFPMDKAFEWLTGGVGNEITFSKIVERNQQRQNQNCSSSPVCQRLDFGVQFSTSSSSSPSEIFRDLVDKMFVYLENKWPMCASSDRPEDLEEDEEQKEKNIRGNAQSSSSWSFCRDCGLISNHGYSIVDVAKFSSNNKNKNKNSDLSSSSTSSLILLKLFNPWGHFVWNGDWCDEYNDKFWNYCDNNNNNNSWDLEEVRKRCGIVSRRDNTNRPVGGVFSDGSFWISLQDFLKEFDYISFCRITSDQLPLRARTWIRHVDEISSKWQSNPMLNHQFLFQIPSCQSSSSSSKSNSHDVLFTRARISLEPVGVIGGGFHFHILPVDDVIEKLQPSSPRIAEITSILSNHHEGENNNRNPNTISQEFNFPRIYETKIVQTTDGGTFAVENANNDHILSSKTTSISKFFLTHDLIKKHQVAHAEGYFGCVFESDGETTKVFQSGKSYLLIPYRVGSGFDGSFCVTIEMNEGNSSSTEKNQGLPSRRKVLRLPVFHLQNHKIIASLQDRFILTSNYRSTLNPQFALVNNSKNDSICVHLVVDLLDQNSNTCSSTSSSTITSEDAGLEIVVVREKCPGSDFVKLLHGRKQVEELLADCSPLYSSTQVTLTTVLPPNSKSIVMPTRSRGTESRFSITVKMRSVNDDHSMISFYKKL